jgi:hypothetical protein
MLLVPQLSKKMFSVIALTLLLPSTAVLVWLEYQLLSANRDLTNATHQFALWGLSSLSIGWIAFWGLLRAPGLPPYPRLMDAALMVAIAGQLLPIFRASSAGTSADVWFMFTWPVLTTCFFYAIIKCGGIRHESST